MNTEIFTDANNFLDEMLKQTETTENTTATTEAAPRNTPTTEEVKQKLEAEKKEVEVIEVEAEEIPNEEPKHDKQDFVTDAIADESADFLIWAIDFFQVLIFKMIAKKRFTKKAKAVAGEDAFETLKITLEKVKENRKNKSENIEYVIEKEEQLLLDLKQRFDDFCDEIDFTEKEIERLKACFKNVLKAKQIKLSDEMKLIITIAIMFGGRYMEMQTI